MIDTPTEALRTRIRDFNALPQWYPGITDSRIEDQLPADRIGCVRRFYASDGVCSASDFWRCPIMTTPASMRSSKAQWA